MNRPKACRAQGCNTINMDGSNYCPKHRKTAKQRPKRVYEHHKVYNTASWRLLSKNKRTKNPFCELCGEITDVVDHIIEIKDREDLALYEENLQCLCHDCHNRKTARVKKARKYNKINEFYDEYIKEIGIEEDPRKF